MSATGVTLTPGGTARVDPRRFDTELAAVWYAANQYYEASFQKAREYIGVVFRDSAGKYGLTVRSDGGFAGSKVRIGDVPKTTTPTAVWHTHLNSSAMKTPGQQLFMLLLTTFDLGWDQFSGDDRTLAEEAQISHGLKSRQGE